MLIRWLIFLYAVCFLGGLALKILESLNVNVWVARGGGMVVAGFAGFVFHKILFRDVKKKDKEESRS